MKSAMLIPDVGMKLVSAPDGGFNLLLKHPIGGHLVTIAHVLHTPDHADGEAEVFGTVLCGAFLMLHALSAIVESIQPDCWGLDTDEGDIWRNALRALCVAQGDPVPAMLQPENHPRSR